MVGDHQTVRPRRSRSIAAADDVGTGRVEVRGGLVEDDQRCIAQEGPRQADALALTRGEPAATLAHDRVVPLGQSANELVGAGQPSGRACAGAARVGVAKPDVVRNGPAKEGRILRDPGDLGPPGGRVTVGEVDVPAVIRPTLGSASRNSNAAMVLLPPPLGPTSATVSPGARTRSTDSRTGRVAPGR